MKRTPRSASRRASRQLAANVPGFRASGAVELEDMLPAPSTDPSVRARDVCMRKAISYCAMRVEISGSPTLRSLQLVQLRQVVQVSAPRSLASNPSGFDR